MEKMPKRTKQKLNLSKLAGGAKGSSLKAGSYFAFDGTTLVYVAAKQKGRDSGYITADIDGNDVHELEGTKNRRQVEDEISELPASDNMRAFISKTATSKPEVYVVGDRIKKMNALQEYHFERTAPLSEAGPSGAAEQVDGDDEDAPPLSKKRGVPFTDRSDRVEEPEPKNVRTDGPERGTKRSAEIDETVAQPEPKFRIVDANVVENDTIIVDREVPQRDTGASGDIVEEVQETHVNKEKVDGHIDSDDEAIQEALRGESDAQKQAAGIEITKQQDEQQQDEQQQQQQQGDQQQDEQQQQGDQQQDEQQQVAPEEPAPSEEETKIHERNEQEAKRVAETTMDVDAAEAVEQQNEVLEQETDVQKRAAAEAAAIIAAAELSVENQLSMGTVVGVSPTTSTAKADANMVHAVDASVARGTKPASDVSHPKKSGDDVMFADKDEDGDQFMSSDMNGLEGNPVEKIGKAGGATSANAVAIVEHKRDVEMKADAKAQAAAEKAKEARDKAESLNAITGASSNVDQAMGQASLNLDPVQPSQELIDQILASAASIPGLLTNHGLEEAEHKAKVDALVLRTAQAEKLKMVKGMNVMRMEAPSPEEHLQALTRAELQKRIEEGTEGEFPVFSPSTSFGEIRGIQDALSTQIGTMTLMQQQELLGEIRPWWNEYRTVRTNQAFHDMERMPTNIITSPVGDVQLGAKIPEGMPQEEEQFLFFMYWAMRTKLQNMESQVAWRDLFKYSAAMGYNDLSQARINWLITGNKDGDTSMIDYENLPYDVKEDGNTPGIEPLRFISPTHSGVVHRAILGTPTSNAPAPGRNVSPSAAPPATKRDYRVIDGKLVALVSESRTLEEQARFTLDGIPSKVSNIPDPRYSERGGKQVKNVRIITIKNPKYDPKDPNAREFISRGDLPAGPDDKFINKEVPDIGAGSKDIDAAIERAEADRLTASLPFKMYAPIHPQACDRYLGERNYARLALPNERYFKSYTQQPFGAEDVQQQFNWNRFVMSTYGPMLYAFVTDQRMQRVDPVFDMTTPDAVTLEFMELNELVGELQRYQSKSADRSSRVGDSAVAQEPIEKHLSDFFDSRDDEEQEKIADANVVMIALPDQDPTSSDSTVVPKPARPGEPKTDADSEQKGTRSLSDQQGSALNYGVRRPPSNQVTLGRNDIDQGVRRDNIRDRQLAYAPTGAHNNVNEPRRPAGSIERRTEIFRRLNR
jgi:hypothetical protein